MNLKAVRFAVLALVAAAGAFGATTASARQCVVNSGAFIIDVKWFPADAIHLDAQGKIATSKLATATKGSIPIGQRSCNESSEQLTAVVAVEGCLNYVPLNGQAPVNCSLVATRGPVEVLPGTLPAAAGCDKGCMQKPHLQTKTKDDAAIGKGFGFVPSIVVVGTIPAGKTLEFTGITGRVAYTLK